MKTTIVAMVVAAAVAGKHELAPGKMDVYGVQMREGTTYVITVSGDGKADIDCAIGDPVTEEFLVKDEAYTDGCTITYTAERTQQYLFFVGNASEHFTAHYTIHSTVMGQVL